VHDLQVSLLSRPAGLRAGFHADVADTASGLHHAGEQWAPARFVIPRHTHPVWEFYLQVHGSTRWIAAGREFAVAPEQLLGVAPNVVHRMADRSPGSHHFHFAAIDMRPVFRRHPQIGRQWRDAPPALHCTEAHPLTGAFEQLTRELAISDDLGSIGLTLAVDRLVIEVTRLRSPRSPSRLRIHPAVAEIRDLLDREYVSPWTLRDLAGRVGLAPTYFAGIFGHELGISPHRYLIEARINRARQLLAASDLTITAVAMEVGFGSGQHFARVFRQVTGRTPRDYRAALAALSR
jgi:AraC-like DNA-binding protein/mannose-6-phosphate isomerase-like protein (cupin superfamily)